MRQRAIFSASPLRPSSRGSSSSSLVRHRCSSSRRFVSGTLASAPRTRLPFPSLHRLARSSVSTSSSPSYSALPDLHMASSTTPPTPATTARHEISIPAFFDDTALGQVGERLRRVSKRRIRTSLLPPRPDGKPVRGAAVLIPLCNRNGKASVLFTLRAASLKLHHGEVSFPGGMEDPEDEGDPVATALRETEEEIGIPRSSIRVIGTYHQSLSKTKIPVTAVVGFVGDFNEPDLAKQMQVNQSEIDSVFTLTLEELVDSTKHEYRTYNSVTGRFKAFTAGPHPVWGLTAFIMDEALNELIIDNSAAKPAKL